MAPPQKWPKDPNWMETCSRELQTQLLTFVGCQCFDFARVYWIHCHHTHTHTTDHEGICVRIRNFSTDDEEVLVNPATWIGCCTGKKTRSQISQSSVDASRAARSLIFRQICLKHFHFSSNAEFSEKKPKHTNTWSHGKQIWRIPNHKRSTIKRDSRKSSAVKSPTGNKYPCWNDFVCVCFFFWGVRLDNLGEHERVIQFMAQIHVDNQ